MGKETQAPYTDKWNFIGGRLEKGESIFQCAAREAGEEIRTEVRLKHFIGIYQQMISLGNAIAFIFSADIVGAEPKATNEIKEIRWFTREEIKELGENKLLLSPYILDVVDNYGKIKMPLDIIKVIRP